MKKKGFTLVELIAVLVLISIIALMAIPNIIELLRKGKEKSYISDVEEMVSTAQYMYKSKNVRVANFEDGHTIKVIKLNGSHPDDDPYGYEYQKVESWISIEEPTGDETKRKIQVFVKSCKNDNVCHYICGDGENITSDSIKTNPSECPEMPVPAETATTGSCKDPTYNGTNQEIVNKGNYVTYSTNRNQMNYKVGGYIVTVTPEANHTWSDGSSMPKSLTCNITKKSIAVTWGTLTWKYDGSSHSTTATASTGVAGETMTLSIENNSITNIGTQTVTATCDAVTGGEEECSNYELTNYTNTLTVTNAEPTCPTTFTAYSGVYDGQSHTITATGHSGGTLEYRTSTSDEWGATKPSGKNVSDSKTVYVRVNGDSVHSNKDCGSKTITISKRPLTVTAANKSRVYGESNPTLTYTTSGVVSGETAAFTGNLATSATSSSLPGDYDITQGTLALANGTGFIANNYTLSYTKGTLTVTKAESTCPTTFNGYSGAYDGQSHTIAASGHSGGTLEYRTSTSDEWGATKPSGKNVSDSKTVYVRVKGDNVHNDKDCGSKTITISKKTIAVTADSKTREYGENNPAFTYTSNGVISGEAAAFTGVLTTTATATSSVGTYDIARGTLALANGTGFIANNYTLSYTKGTLTVTKAESTCPTTFTAYSGTYDGESHTITVSEHSGGTLEYRTSETDEWSSTKPTRTNAGTITVYVRVKGDSNHNDKDCGSKTITISKKTITVTADDKTREYGENNPTLTYKSSGAISGETPVFTGSLTTSATTSSLPGDYDINQGTLDLINGTGFIANNYTLSYEKGILTITQSESTCPSTFDNYSGTYDGQSHTIAASGHSGGTLEYRTSTSDEWSSTKPTRANAGTTTVYVRVKGDSAHSNKDCGSKTITISKKTITVTGTDKTRAYDESNPTLTYTYSGNVSGETPAFTGELTTTATASSLPGDYDITQGTLELTNGTGFIANNYTLSYTKGTLTITSAETICPTTFNNYSGTYDGQSHTITATGHSGGTLEYRTSTTDEWSSTKPTRANVGTITVYVMVKGDSNHNDKDCGSKTITISKKTLTVTGTDKTRAYGESNPTLTYTYSGNVSGETPAFTGSLTTTATTSSGVGTYDITQGTLELTDGTGFIANNYTLSYTKGTLTVTKAESTCPTTFTAYSGIYDGSSHTITATGHSGGTLEYRTSTTDEWGATKPTATNVSDSKTVYVMVKGDSNHSDKDCGSKTITISKTTITVTADDKTRAYGEANPTFTYTSSEEVSGETPTFTGSLTTTATTSSGVGTYDITQGTLALTNGTGFIANNYTLSYEKGTLTITQSEPTCPTTFNNYSGTYDGQSHTITATGHSGGTLEYRASEADEWGATKPSATNVSDSKTVYVMVKGDSNHSDKDCGSKTITISQKALAVLADNKTRIYGEANPTFTYTSSGVVSGETASFTGSLTTFATLSSPIGNYDITQGTLELTNGTGFIANNYSLSYTKGTLTITKAESTCPTTFDNYSGTYNGTSHTITATGHSGGTLEYRTSEADEWGATKPSATNVSDSKTVYVMVKGDSNHNDKDCGSKTITISKKTLTVTAANKTREYGENNPTFTYTSTGAISGETPAFSGSLTTSATTTSPAGDYDITQGTLALTNGTGFIANNYTLSYVKGTLTITERIPEITCPTLTEYVGTYDGTEHTITATGESGGTLEYRTSTSDEWGATKPTATNVSDSKTVYVRVRGDNSNKDCGSSTITITPKELTTTLSDCGKTYNGNITASCTVTYSGTVNEDSITGGATCSFADPDVGTSKTVTCLSFTKSGTGNNNYSVPSSKTTAANITAKSISVSWGTLTWTFNNTAHSTTYSATTGVTGETMALRVTSGTNSITSSGTQALTVGCDAVTGGQAKCSNYSLTNTSATLTVNCNKTVTGTLADEQIVTYAGKSWTVNGNPTSTKIKLAFNGYTDASGTESGSTAGNYTNAEANVTKWINKTAILKDALSANCITHVGSDSGNGTTNKPSNTYFWLGEESVYVPEKVTTYTPTGDTYCAGATNNTSNAIADGSRCSTNINTLANSDTIYSKGANYVPNSQSTLSMTDTELTTTTTDGYYTTGGTRRYRAVASLSGNAASSTSMPFKKWGWDRYNTLLDTDHTQGIYEEYTNTKVLKIKICGGTYHNQFAQLEAYSTTHYKYTSASGSSSNYQYATDRYFYFAGSGTSTTSGSTPQYTRTYDYAGQNNCSQRTKYTVSNGTAAKIFYRPYIILTR